MKLLLNILGILLVLAISWLISWDKKSVKWKKVGVALITELIIAILVVKVPIGQKIITLLSNGLTAVINCGNEGLTFVFGDLFTSDMSIFIIKGLGNIIFVSAFVSVLYYLGAIGFVVKWIGKAVGKLMGTTEVESFVAVANMFLGHTDSPILVSKYLKDLTDSEIFLILVSGMGSMSASILGGYHMLGIPMEYLLIASAMVPIGSIMISKIISPQTENAKSITDVKMDNKGNNTNVIDAMAEGANTGMQMVISIGASIVGFVGIVAVNVLFEGTLLGNKVILNEFVAFQELSTKLSTLDTRTGMICAISLCGFANLSSMGMCIGGIGVLCPEKRGTISRLVFRSMIGGAFVSITSALIVSMVTLF